MKKNIIFMCALFLTQMLNSQTVINSGAMVAGNWKQSNSPYYIKGNISVPKDSTLTIEPGVDIRFDGKYQIAVYGKIRALGKEGDTIRFYPQDTLNRWRGIRFYGNSQVGDSAIFEYCKFEYTGPKLSNFESALTLKRGNFKISHCLFNRNTTVIGANSINTDSTLSCIISDCYFYRNSNMNTNPSITQRVFGVVGISNGKIENCLFEENSSYNPFNSLDKYSVNGDGSGGIIYVTDISNKNANVEVINCRFLKNSCALRGAGIDISFSYNGRIFIKGCQFINNRTGRFGCITSIGNINNAKGNMKVTIEGCAFKNNIAANPTVLDGISCIKIESFKSYDSLLIRNNLFENNTARSTVSIGTPNESRQYVIGNVFRGNAFWCVANESSGEVFSINNLYYNNLATNIFGTSNQNFQLTSINDAFVFNGPNLDTIALNQRLLNTYVGQYYKFDGSAYMGFGGGGVFRNCIFWGNRNYDGKITNITLASGKVKEISNCIFEGNSDSSIIWDNSASRPNPIVTLFNANLIKNPLFIKPPQTYGPNSLDTTTDFRLINTCSQLSPAYNAGLNSAYPGLSSIRDFENNVRISCDTVDIGPFELGPQYARVKLLSQHKDSVYCDNNMTLVNKSTCNPNSRYTLQKQNGSAWTDISSSSSSTYMGNSPSQGRYRVIYTQLDCGNSDTGNTFNVTLKQSPKPFLGNDTAIEQKATLVLNPGQFNAYKWQDGSSNSTFTINGNTAGIGKKTYYVSVTAQNGCSGSDTIAVTVTWNSSLQSILDKGWKLYPNPSSGVMNIESPDNEPFSFQVMDWMGNLMFGKEAETEHSVIDLGDLPSGVYFIQIKGKGFTENLRVVKL